MRQSMKSAGKLSVLLSLAACLSFSLTSNAQLLNPPDLQQLSDFAILSGGTITIEDYTEVEGLVGSATNTIVNPAGAYLDIAADQLVNDAFNAFQDIRAHISAMDTTTVADTNLSGMHFEAGVIRIPGNAIIDPNSIIYLVGDPDDVFIFNIEGELLVGQNVSIKYDNVDPRNIYWNVENDVHVNTNSQLVGIILAGEEVTLDEWSSGTKVILAGDDVTVTHSLGIESADMQGLTELAVQVRQFLADRGLDAYAILAEKGIDVEFTTDQTVLGIAATLDTAVDSSLHATNGIYTGASSVTEQALTDVKFLRDSILDPYANPFQVDFDLVQTPLYRNVYEFAGDLTIEANAVIQLAANAATDQQLFVFHVLGDLHIQDSVKVLLDGVAPDEVIWLIEGTAEIGQESMIPGIFITMENITIEERTTGEKVILTEHKAVLQSGSGLTSIKKIQETIAYADPCNLVPNPGFEEHPYGCPYERGQMYWTTYWDSYESPDYFHKCGRNEAGVQKNYFGDQLPKNGDGYTGLATYVENDNFREYLRVKLKASLVKGQKYKVGFFCSPADKPDFVSELGLNISRTPFFFSDWWPSGQYSHIISDGIIYDTKNWTEVFGTFTPQEDGEYYITIGNLDNNANTAYDDNPDGSHPISFNNEWTHAYYYIDDVYVRPIASELIVNAGSDKTICRGSTTVIGGSPTASGGVPGTAGYTYEWTPANTLNNPKAPNPVASSSVTTTYTVTVKDASGCGVATDQVTVTVNPVPNPVIEGPAEACGDEIELTTSQPFTTYKWYKNWEFTGVTSASYLFIPANGDIITVEVTNSFGCSKESLDHIMTVTTPGPITAGFTFPRFDNTEEQDVYFTDNSVNASLIHWDFGDGQSGSSYAGLEFAHSYDNPGFYLVTSTATNACGSLSQQIKKIVHILPSTAGYNPNACVRHYSNKYDHIDLTIDKAKGTVSNPYLLPGNTSIKGDLVIETGAALTIGPGVVVRFGPQAKVIVQQGALLNLNGCTLTSVELAACNDGKRMMWQGIEVWGAGKLSQNPANQGRLIINNARIEDAYNAVILGKMIFNTYLSGSEPYFELDKHEAAFDGGILTATNAVFNRNSRSVVFWEYNFLSSSSISNSRFQCKDLSGQDGTLLDPYCKIKTGITANDYEDSPIKFHNPFIYGANSIGNSQAGIYAFKVKRVPVIDNRFSNHNIGIWHSAQLRIAGTDKDNPFSLFQNCITGINAAGITASIYASDIERNWFTNMKENAISSSGNKYEKISLNKLSNDVFQGENNAVKLQYSTNFNVVDNIAEKFRKGIYVTGSGNSASLIGYETNGNVLINCENAIETSGTNNKLSIHCNTIDFPDADSYGYAWYIDGTLPSQGHPAGYHFGTPSPKDPAGNSFLQYDGGAFARSHIEAQTSTWFSYYHHKDGFTRPEKADPTYSTFTKVNTNIDYQNKQAACAPIPCELPCDDQRIQVQGEIEELMEEFGMTQESQDGGQTPALMLSVQQGILPAVALKTLLVNHSPLSDAVLLAVLDREPALPASILTEILIPNLPVSAAVWDALPAPLIQELAERQAYNPGYRTLTAIERDIQAREIDRQLLLNKAVRYHVGQNRPELAYALLEAETNPEAGQTLAASYIEDGRLEDASRKLQQLLPAEQAFTELYGLYLQLAREGRSLWELSAAEKETVVRIAGMCPASLATVNAQNLLEMIYREQIPLCPQQSLARKAKPVKLNGGHEVSAGYLGANIPNPFTGKTLIPYQIPVGVQQAKLLVTDITGHILKSYMLNLENPVIELDMAEYKNGLYLYTLEIDGQPIETKRMILTQN